jgi:NAD(P) transhydrogenase
MTSVIEYDLVVIGSGPGGQKAAVAAAKFGKSVAVIERGDVGGVCVNTGTIPSKSMREAVVYLTGVNQHELYGTSYRVKDRITWTDLHVRTEHVINREIDVIRSQLKRNGIELYTGQGRFIDEHTVLVESPNRGEHITLGGQYVVIATGTTPARPAGVQFDEERVIDSDGILNLGSIPSSMVVVGAGVIGAEYASIFAALGTKVTVVEKRDTMLDFCDQEIIDDLRFYLCEQCVTLRLGEEVTTVDIGKEGTVTTLASGKKIAAETVMYSAGRQGSTWPTPACRPTAAGVSSSTTNIRPKSTTSTRSATSSVSPRSPRPRWSRAGWPTTSRSAFTPSPSCPTWAQPNQS